jgi:RNA polymerase sigma factor (sigma-70 family)
MSDATLARARVGDEEAFRALTEPHRRELHVHCYRLLGSVQDAEDLVQETLLAAWRGLAEFEGRSSLRSWLYRIATNRCLNALRASGARPQRMIGSGPPPDAPEPTRLGEPIWLQPYPDTLLDHLPDRADGPDVRYETKEAVGLAFVSGLQRMAPQQRAVLVLRDVLGYRAAEVAAMLDTTEASVTSALRRARAALDATPERPGGGTLPDSRAERPCWLVSATRSSAATSTRSSRCSPRTRGSARRPSPTSTRDTPRSRSSSAHDRCGAPGPACAWCPRGPTGNRPLPVTSQTHAPAWCEPADCSY